MKKLFAAAALSLIAAGLSATQASAGFLHNFCCCHHCCCDRGTITLRQYNAFTPVACAGVVTNHCVNVYPCGDAGPCCAQNPFVGGNGQISGGEIITQPAPTMPGQPLPSAPPSGGRQAFPPMPSTTPPANGSTFLIPPTQAPFTPPYTGYNGTNAFTGGR